MLATDNHIGYGEKDPIRGQDAINTFREILELARDHDVDFILLAGDLFHENRPSRTCMHQTIALLREFTLGDKPIPFELLSDPMDGATPGYSFPAVNYEDPNLNIAIPVFSIHGNHDDPQGTGPEGALCALDVLSVSGMLNYFGKVDLSSDEANEGEDDGIKIRPILLRKGTTHLAMYGVGNVRDMRMHYELRSNRVKMFMPEGGEVAENDWFNMLLVHQNRVKHGPQQSVPEGMFDDSIKLVVWGHEHDCRIWPEPVEGKPYFITQPGSSVATSLHPGEALPKNVGILSIQGDKFQIEEILLKTVRPFELDEVILEDEAANADNDIDLEDKDTISAFLRQRVEELIATAQNKWEEGHDPETEEMMLPLIRLKVETSAAKEMTNPIRFGQDFINRVANHKDILQYYRKKKGVRKTANLPDQPDFDDEDDEGGTTRDRQSQIHMGTLVKQYLLAQNLEVLKSDDLEYAVMRFIDKDDKDAIKDFVDDALKGLGKGMKNVEGEVDETNVDEVIAQVREAQVESYASQAVTSKSTKSTKRGKKVQDSDDSMVAEDSMMEQDSDEPEPVPARRGKAAATTKSRAAATTKGKGRQPLFTPASENDSDDSDVMSVSPPPKSKAKAPARGAAPKRGAARGTTIKKAATPRTTKAAASSSRQSQLNFSKARGSKLVDSDSD
ncbi:meiotic recombination [Apiotrichum porosum]|uniref:Double-strand break repair protein n=1 Tax=Apiotrichum porosum TaxID=105984 RepID=A0A427XF28_9TREE|nr:meiotic recombination [Apiotrichum porosum]RSH77499.1 meiotic recombination [Apiotrichum porosum]